MKIACEDYGPLAPYTLTLLEALFNSWMTPYDWTQVAKACLTGGNYLLWRTEYEDMAKKQASDNKRTRGRFHINKDMLLAKGNYDSAQGQLYLEKETLIQATAYAVNAWRALSITTEKTTTLGEVKQ